MDGIHPLDAQALAGLRFSAATAAFQIEGARTADGRGRSIWDDFVDTPGNVVDGSTAEPGPYSYHRFDEDIALLAGLGLDRYRFSISWTRIVPEAGTDPSVNTAGLAYYDRLADRRLAALITQEPPHSHCALPGVPEAAGGWLTRDAAHLFVDYAAAVAERLADRGHHRYSINDPASPQLQREPLPQLSLRPS